jgi:Cell wall-active antibiotics response 4TMS YvqF/Domain of unknown function (DUF5668)
MNATDRNLIQHDLPPTNEAPKPKTRHSWWAYLLIGLGVLTLLDRFGIPTWGIWNVTGMWWPLVLIVVGVGLLTRQYIWGRPLTVGLVIAGMLLVVFWNRSQPAFRMGQSTENISQAITATRGEIQIGTTIGRLEIGANTSGKLIDGTLELGNRNRLEREFTTRGSAQFVRLEAGMNGPSIGLPYFMDSQNSDWKLGLSPNIPLVLRIKTGVGKSEIDLSKLRVTDFTLEGGVGAMSITLPATGRVMARIESGVGSTKIRIPNGMKARIRASSGIGEVRVLGSYERDGDVYTSSGFETASNRLELEIKGGIGQITVESGL